MLLAVKVNQLDKVKHGDGKGLQKNLGAIRKDLETLSLTMGSVKGLQNAAIAREVDQVSRSLADVRKRLADITAAQNAATPGARHVRNLEATLKALDAAIARFEADAKVGS